MAIGLCVALLVGAAGLYGTEYLLTAADDDAGEDSGERQAVRVGTTTPERIMIDDAVTAVGSLRPVRSIELMPYTPGRVSEVPVTSGQEVAAGDLILQLDDSTARAALAEAEATLSEAGKEFRRIEELVERNTQAEARLEEVRANFARAEAAVSSARARVDDHRIVAPFAGTLGFVDIEPGAFLNMSTSVTRLVDLSSIELAAELSERYFEAVRPGLTVSVTVPAYPDRTFEGEILVRSPEIDPVARNFAFRARLDNPDRLLAGGMFADARVVLDRYEGLVIADDAIISEGLTTYVFTVEEGTARRTEVTPGVSVGARTEVREGLGPDLQVVISGWDQLSDGTPVEVADDIATEGLE